MKLTDTKCKHAGPRDKIYKLADGHGLYLEVKPTGARYWRYKYRIAAKEKRIAFGVYPDVSLQDVRELHRDAHKLVKAGIDPVEDRKRIEREKRLQAVNTFELVAREWHKQASVQWSDEHTRNILHTMERDIFPVIGNCVIAELKPADLLDVVKQIEARGALDVAARALQRINRIYQYAVTHLIVDSNPAQNLSGAIKTRKVQHRSHFSAQDLPNFYVNLRAYDGHELTRLGLEFALLTFVRSTELREARWAEFDGDIWRIPPERMKTNLAHIVPLSDRAISILAQIKALDLNSDYVFPQQQATRKVMSENTLLFALYRMGYHSRATVHGFRSTASTILNEHGFRPDVIERQLAHVESNSVRAAYNHSDYLKERREMMQWWSDYLSEVNGSAKVIPIYGKAKSR